MSTKQPIPVPTGGGLGVWAQDLVSYLRVLESNIDVPGPKIIQLEHKTPAAKAAVAGLLMFDAATQVPVYSAAGAWHSMVGGGGGGGGDYYDKITSDARFVNIAGDSMTGPLYQAADPVAPLGTATKQYVDSKISGYPFDPTLYYTKTASDARYVKLAGDSMSGLLVLSNDPSVPLGAATKQYVDARAFTAANYYDKTASDARFVNITGDTLTGPLILAADPSLPLGTATKQYVDAAVATGGGAYLPLTGGTLTGQLLIENTSPSIRWHETDAVDPGGRWQMNGFGAGSFAFYRMANLDWGGTGAEVIWSVLPPTDVGVTPAYPTRFSFTAPIASTLHIMSPAPRLDFTEADQTDPAGRFRLYATSGNFYLQEATAAAWAGAKSVFNYIPSTNKFTFTPDVVLGGEAVVLEFDESSVTTPASHYRFMLDGGNFSLQKAATANFGTNDLIFQHRAPDMGGTDTFNIYKGVSLGGVVGTSTASLKIDASYPSIWFADNTPSGSYANQMISAGNSTMRFGTVDAAGGAFDVFMTASPLEVNIVPITRLSTGNGSVEIGHATGSQIVFKRSGINYMMVPNTWSLRVQSDTAVAWATVSSASGWTAGSDIKLKKNVEPISYGLDAVLAMKPVEFNWIADGKRDIGFVAQDMIGVVPEVIDDLDDDNEKHTSTLHMRKDALVAVLVKAVQELALRVGKLEAA